MRKLVLTLVAFIAVATFIRAYSNPTSASAAEVKNTTIENKAEH